MYMEMHTSKAASDGVQQSSWSGFGRTFLVNLLYMHMYIHVQYASKKSYHTVEINRRLDGTTVPK